MNEDLNSSTTKFSMKTNKVFLVAILSSFYRSCHTLKCSLGQDKQLLHECLQGKIFLYTGVLLCFCLVGESQIGSGEFLKSGRRILNSIGVIIASHIPFGRRIKNVGRRIKDFFLPWAGEIHRSPGQNKTPAYNFLKL